jgi:hypothetical protein
MKPGMITQRIQSLAMRYQAKRMWERMQRSVIIIQKIFRGFMERMNLVLQKRGAIRLQACWRGNDIRKHSLRIRRAKWLIASTLGSKFRRARQNHAAIVIQHFYHQHVHPKALCRAIVEDGVLRYLWKNVIFFGELHFAEPYHNCQRGNHFLKV